MTTDRTSLVTTLISLRWVAAAGQSAAVVCVAFGLGVTLPLWPMGVAIGLLLAFNVYASQRVRQGGDASPHEVFCHIAMDVAVLTFLIGCSGGPANPFTSLFLLPIAFAALALPQRWIYATAALCGLGYALAAAFGRPLPHVHGLMMDGFDLHLLGMAVNFVISAAVFAYFLARMASQRREREAELARLRERFARDEGILALATHAASVAHELNTPLATMLLVLDDVDTSGLSDALAEDIDLLHTLAGTCRERVRELARAASLGECIDPEQAVERWHLLRPSVMLEREATLPPGVRVDATVGHLLRALLDNAADAGESAGDARVVLTMRCEDGVFLAQVRDHGRGFEAGPLAARDALFRSDKPGGMGVGLALARAAIERLGGELTIQADIDGGTRAAFHVPIAGSDE